MSIFQLTEKQPFWIRPLILLVFLIAIGFAIHSCRAYNDNPYPPPNQQKYITADGVPFLNIHEEHRLYPGITESSLYSERQEPSRYNMHVFFYYFAYLKSLSHSDLSKISVSRSIWNPRSLQQNPNPWRGHTLRVSGRLQSLDTLEWSEMPSGLQKLFRLTIRDDAAWQNIMIITPEIPIQDTSRAGKGLTEAKPYTGGLRVFSALQDPGSPLMSDAIFVGLYKNPELQNNESLPLFVAKRVSLATTFSPPPTLFDPRAIPAHTYNEITPLRSGSVTQLDSDSVRQIIVDSNSTDESFMTSLAMNLIDEYDAYVHIFEYLYSSSELKPNRLLTYDRLMADDAIEAFLQPVLFQGSIIDVETLSVPNHPSGVTRIHRLMGIDRYRVGGQNMPWSLLALNIPKGLRADDELMATGLFVKRFPVRMQDGKIRRTPLLLVRDITIVGKVGETSLRSIRYITGALTSLGIAGIIWLFLMSRKDDKDLLERRKKRK